jgi:hypothetical protein
MPRLMVVPSWNDCDMRLRKYNRFLLYFRNLDHSVIPLDTEAVRVGFALPRGSCDWFYEISPTVGASF